MKHLKNMPAKLPDNYVRKPVRHVKDTAMGETFWMTFTDMLVDAAGYCYLKPDAAVRPEARINVIRVTRFQDGFHVTIPADCDWRLGTYEEYQRVYDVDLIPVETIVEAKPESSGRVPNG